MARRYKRKIDWHWLRSITEKSLNESGKFPGKVSVDGKIKWIESGLYHDNYRFWIRGIDLRKEWKEKSLLLRLSSQKSPLRSSDDAGNYLNREAKTLQGLENAGFRFETPELLCRVIDDSGHPIGLIETWVRGIPVTLYKESIYQDMLIPTIAEVAVSVHQLETKRFGHLRAFENSKVHVLNELGSFSPELFKEFSAAHRAREWILSRIPESRPAVVLHGDLLPQNIMCYAIKDEWRVALIDWEFAEIGDPAYDLAIVTRGDRKLMGINNGLELLIDAYRQADGIELSVADVRIHELILILNWLWNSAKRHRNGKTSGHGPDYYLQRLKSLLRRAEKCY
jgi:aminoglycoside phosphotransferase (APT) family kinase protein